MKQTTGHVKQGPTAWCSKFNYPRSTPEQILSCKDLRSPISDNIIWRAPSLFFPIWREPRKGKGWWRRYPHGRWDNTSMIWYLNEWYANQQLFGFLLFITCWLSTMMHKTHYLLFPSLLLSFLVRFFVSYDPWSISVLYVPVYDVNLDNWTGVIMSPWLSISSRQKGGGWGSKSGFWGRLRARVCLCGWHAGEGRCEGREPENAFTYGVAGENTNRKKRDERLNQRNDLNSNCDTWGLLVFPLYFLLSLPSNFIICFSKPFKEHENQLLRLPQSDRRTNTSLKRSPLSLFAFAANLCVIGTIVIGALCEGLLQELKAPRWVSSLLEGICPCGFCRLWPAPGL